MLYRLKEWPGKRSGYTAVVSYIVASSPLRYPYNFITCMYIDVILHHDFFIGGGKFTAVHQRMLCYNHVRLV